MSVSIAIPIIVMHYHRGERLYYYAGGKRAQHAGFRLRSGIH
jgi:hypothetical protein